MKLDSKDKKIIEILRTDSRMAIRDIAKKTKFRPSTIHQRIQKLKASGVIEHFTIKCNNKLINENFIVIMLITTKKDLDKSFLRNSHIKEVFGVTGEYDLMLKLKFADVEEFNKFLLDTRKEDYIEKTLTMVSTTILKESL